MTSTTATRGPSLPEIVTERLTELKIDLETLWEVASIQTPRPENASLLEEDDLSFNDLQALSRVLGVDLAIYDPELDTEPARWPQITTLLKANQNFCSRQEWSLIIEAAEIARDIVALEDALGYPPRFKTLRERFTSDGQMHDPIWREGQRLAEGLRQQCGLKDEPIRCMESFCQSLHVALIEIILPDGIQGLCLADAAHGPTIIINLQGRNENILVKRFSLAHELCHVLFDRHEQHSLSHFDVYHFGQHKPDIEVRADAFSVHLLAPGAGVVQCWNRWRGEGASHSRCLQKMMRRYGLSFSAARSHALNLNLLPRGQAQKIWASDSSAVRHFNAQSARRPDDLGDLAWARSGRLLDLTVEALSRQRITRSRALELLDVDGPTLDRRLPQWTDLVRSRHAARPSPPRLP